MTKIKTPRSRAALVDDPLWYKDAIIYELHVRAFADDDGDGVGDFRGLTKRLDYLQDLGVTALWILWTEPYTPKVQWTLSVIILSTLFGLAASVRTRAAASRNVGKPGGNAPAKRARTASVTAHGAPGAATPSASAPAAATPPNTTSEFSGAPSK